MLGKRNTELPKWKKRMIERQRKTLVVWGILLFFGLTHFFELISI
ncbi:hypothetical protein [Wolbachia endosymbiont of Cylisticus convexus]